MDSRKDWSGFWRRAIGVDPSALEQNQRAVSSRGRYLELSRGLSLHLFADLATGSRVLVASPSVLAEVGGSRVERETLPLEELGSWRPGRGFALEYSDIEHVLVDKPGPDSRLKGEIRPIFSTTPELDSFFEDCSEDDKDTLDLTFEEDTCFGSFDGGVLNGVARYLDVSETNVSDITILVRSSCRGRGIAAPLAAHAINHIVAAGRTLKYRASENNLASRRVAAKLGLRPAYRLWTWSRTPV